VTRLWALRYAIEIDNSDGTMIATGGGDYNYAFLSLEGVTFYAVDVASKQKRLSKCEGLAVAGPLRYEPL
jgi:hypothetical protein